MPDGESPKKRDLWDKADVVGKLMIPIVIAGATFAVNMALGKREARQKTFEVAIGILQAPSAPGSEPLREWALKVFQDGASRASSKLPDDVASELRKRRLPSTSQLQLPGISIYHLEGASTDQSEGIKKALLEAGYINVRTQEASRLFFPEGAEVRFYYAADSQKAKSVSDLINTHLHIATQVHDRSQDPDAFLHGPGDIHVYVR